jgi:hypothetical protein
MRCFARFFSRTGWNVPAPTCSVTQDAARRERREQRLVEVQARGRRGDGARGARIHRLVAALVPGLRRVADVRRERNAAVALEELEHRGAIRKTQAVELPLAPEHSGFE